MDGREDINGEKTSSFHDVWLMQYGTSDPGFTFNTLEDTLTKRVNNDISRNGRITSDFRSVMDYGTTYDSIH